MAVAATGNLMLLRCGEDRMFGYLKVRQVAHDENLIVLSSRGLAGKSRVRGGERLDPLIGWINTGGGARSLASDNGQKNLLCLVRYGEYDIVEVSLNSSFPN